MPSRRPGIQRLTPDKPPDRENGADDGTIITVTVLLVVAFLAAPLWLQLLAYWWQGVKQAVSQF